MPSDKTQIKQITIRWRGEFWETVAVLAKRRRTSVQAIVTEAVAKHLKIAPPKSLPKSEAA